MGGWWWVVWARICNKALVERGEGCIVDTLMVDIIGMLECLCLKSSVDSQRHFPPLEIRFDQGHGEDNDDDEGDTEDTAQCYSCGAREK